MVLHTHIINLFGYTGNLFLLVGLHNQKSSKAADWGHGILLLETLEQWKT